MNKDSESTDTNSSGDDDMELDLPKDELFEKEKMKLLARMIDSARQNELLERELEALGLSDKPLDEQRRELMKMVEIEKREQLLQMLANKLAEDLGGSEDSDSNQDGESDGDELREVRYGSGSEESIMHASIERETVTRVDLDEVYVFLTRTEKQEVQIFTMTADGDDMVIVFESEKDAGEFMKHLTSAESEFRFYKMEKLPLSEVLETCQQLGYELGLIEEGGLVDLNISDVLPTEKLSPDVDMFETQIEKRNVNPEMKRMADQLNRLLGKDIKAKHVDESENVDNE